ncbi:MAG: VanZ family protein [Spirochaetes bacterium]|nr:VanZ family protein [Spirochaetota bacterium]
MKKIAAYKFTILTAAIILIALLVPAKIFNEFPTAPGIDKVVHFILFFLFTFAYGQEYRKEHKKVPDVFIETAAVMPLILVSELLQLFTRSRHFELLDMVADAIGASAAIFAAGLYHLLCGSGKKKG